MESAVKLGFERFIGTFVVLLLSLSSVAAAELIMVEEAGCPWCRQWNQEVGVIYDKTEEGRAAPLRRIDIHKAVPAGLRFASPPVYTPTFILVDRGEEVGRIEGYPGEDFFWGLLQNLLEKLPARDRDARS